MRINQNPAPRARLCSRPVSSPASPRAAAAGSLGGPLELQDEGVFYVNAQTTRTEFPDTPATGAATPGEITIDQMYVQYRIPKTIAGPPIIMVHGSGHTGVTYETTPDGREGWATYFARHGFPVYVVDHVGRGRSGFDPTAINRAKAQSNPAPPAIGAAHHARARLSELPDRRQISDALSGPAVPGGGAGPVFRAARAQHRDAARRRRQQHRQGAGRAGRQDRAGRGDGAFAIGRLRPRADPPASRQGARLHRHRGQLRTAQRRRRRQVLPQGADPDGVRRLHRRLERPQRRRAPQRLQPIGRAPSTRPAAPPSSSTCRRSASRATATC